MNDIQTNAAILEGLELIVNLIAKYETIEILYLRSSSLVEASLKRDIVQLYVTILCYLLEAHRHFSQSTVTRLAKSFFQLESATAGFVANVKIASSNVDSHLKLFTEEHRQKASSSITHLTAYLSSLKLDDLAASLKVYDEPITRMCNQLSTIEDNLRSEDRMKVFKWLTTIEYQSHHKSRYKTLLPGSGQWLLDKPEFIEWQAASTSSILWLHGIPGSGKSMLLAHVIEHMKAQGSAVHPAPIAFFYCARIANEPERADPTHLMRSILEQMSCVDEDTPIREPIVKEYKVRKKEAKGKLPEPLSLDDTVQLVLELLESNPAILVIDGLDECEPSRRQDLLNALTNIIHKSSNVVKVFVSSRDDQDLVHHLSQTPNIYIRAAENTSDIIKFVETRVDDAIARKKILLGKVPDDLRKAIIKSLVEKAQGMFRLVSLHIETLCDPSRIKTRLNVLSLLSALPRDLKLSYDGVLAQIRTSEDDNPGIADRIFKWLLCARAPLQAEAFLVAISTDHAIYEPVSRTEALSICNNFVVYDDETDRFRFVHLSAQEYLLQLEDYSLEKCNAQLAQQSLTWLMDPFFTCEWPLYYEKYSDGNIPSFTALRSLDNSVQLRQDDMLLMDGPFHNFAQYIDEYWAAHVQSSRCTDHQSIIWRLLNQFLLETAHLTSSESYFSIWAKRRRAGVSVLAGMVSVFTKSLGVSFLIYGHNCYAVIFIRRSTNRRVALVRQSQLFPPFILVRLTFPAL